jgi:hypothetical protein
MYINYTEGKNWLEQLYDVTYIDSVVRTGNHKNWMMPMNNIILRIKKKI